MNEGSEDTERISLDSLRAEPRDLEEMDEPADDVELDDDSLASDGEEDADKTVELDLKEAKPKAKRSRAKRPRTTRAKKAAEPAPEEPVLVVEHREEEPAPAPVAPLAMPVAEVEHIREDASITSASLHKTMESMVKQWTTVKEISHSICQDLERVNTVLKTPPPAPEPVDVKEYLRQAAPRITLANKIALAVSAAAVVVSALSLSLASSTRSKVLENPALAAALKAPAAPVAAAPKPRPKPKPEPEPVVAIAEPVQLKTEIAPPPPAAEKKGEKKDVTAKKKSPARKAVAKKKPVRRSRGTR